MTRKDYKDGLIFVMGFVLFILMVLKLVETEAKDVKDSEAERVVEADRRCRSLCSASGTKASFLEFKVGSTGPYTCRCQELP